MANGTPTYGGNEPSASQKRSIYWFEDATLTIQVQDTHFRVHHSLISRHSIVFKGLKLPLGTETTVVIAAENVEVNRLHLLLKEAVSVEDFQALLAHLYHDEPLTKASGFNRVVSMLRVSGSNQLDFPRIHALARNVFEEIIPSEPHRLNPDIHSLYEALEIATRYKLTSIRKAILYWMVTTHHFEDDDEEVNSDDLSPQSGHHPRSLVSEPTRELCRTLLTRIIEHFTALLYTPAGGSHMACTDRFADLWMPYVIQPSFEDDGVYKPLETLDRIKNIDWEKEGVCASCVAEKRDEWSEEQETVWRRMDDWVGLGPD